MPENWPAVTIIIPARPGPGQVQAVQAARSLDYPAGKLEILLARGKQPSAQRNAALRAATGELIYFLDDDSIPAQTNLRQAVAHFSDKQVVMVGGPSLCPPEAPGIEKVFAVVLSSWLAFGPSRARYLPVGKARPSSEKELILCNLMARREPLMQLGGFNEALYPNEENALMDELQKRGGRLVYDPALSIYRRPRPNLKAFARMLFTYGRGRAEQFRLHPTPGSAPNFVPPLFCMYLLTLAGLPWTGWPLLLPLGLYAVVVVGQVALLAATVPVLRALGAGPLIVLTHVLYGLGFWRGLFTPLQTGGGDKRPAPVDLERIVT